MTNLTVPNSLEDVFKMPIEEIKEQFSISHSSNKGNVSKNVKDTMHNILKNSCNGNTKLSENDVKNLKKIRNKLHPLDVGFIYTILDSKDSAKIHFEKVTEDEREIYYTIQIFLGDKKMHKGDVLEAKEHFENVSKEAGKYYGEAQAYMGLIAYNEKDFLKAKEYFANVPKEAGKYYGRAQTYMGLIAYDEGNFVKAKEYFANVSKEAGECYWSVQNHIGLIAYDEGDFLTAKKYFENVSEEAGQYYWTAQYNLINVSIQYRHIATGLKHLENIPETAGKTREDAEKLFMFSHLPLQKKKKSPPQKEDSFLQKIRGMFSKSQTTRHQAT